MIPKRIFTVWLSEDRKIPPFIQKCIDTHKLEGYEHRLITLDNCFKGSKYIQECLNSPYLSKKWCKASDYLRMHYLLTEGGIYLDADVEILPGMNFDHLLDNQAFVGKEQSGRLTILCTAVVGSEAGHPLIAEWKQTVEENFRGDDELCYESSMHQLNIIGVKYQDRMQLLEPDVFYPYNNLTGEINITPNTIAIHRFDKSWTENTLDKFTKYIKNGINFSFVKKGDGELACMNMELGGNCDGHPYTPALGNKLKDAFEFFKSVPNVTVVDFDKQNEYNILLHRTDSDLRRVSVFYKAIITAGGGSEYGADRQVVFIGPNKLKPIAEMFNAKFVEVPSVNAFFDYRNIKYNIPIVQNGIYIFCAGMMSKVLIADILKATINIGIQVTCIDSGSAFDPYVDTTRTFQISREEFVNLYKNVIDNYPTVSIIIPQLGREEGFRRCLESIKNLNYPQHKIEVIVEEGLDTVPVKVKKGFEKSTGDYICYAANDMEFTPDSLKIAIEESINSSKGLVAFNSGQVLPDLGNICEHFIIRRDLVDKIGGEIFDTRLHHVGVDNILWARASSLDEALRSEKAVIFHKHFSKGYAYDEIYEKGWKEADKDRELLKNLI